MQEHIGEIKSTNKRKPAGYGILLATVEKVLKGIVGWFYSMINFDPIMQKSPKIYSVYADIFSSAEKIPLSTKTEGQENR